MRKFLLTVAVVALTGSASYAGPFGLFGRCHCSQSACQPKCGPVEKVVRQVVEARPVATCVGNACHAVGNVIESRPVVTTVRGLVGGCPNGQCPNR